MERFDHAHLSVEKWNARNEKHLIPAVKYGGGSVMFL